MGKVTKGIKCSVAECGKEAVRALPTDKVVGAGLKINDARHTYLCKDHYKEFKKATKKDRVLDKLRFRT